MKKIEAKLQCTITKLVTLEIPDHMTESDIDKSNIYNYAILEHEIDQIDYKILSVFDCV